MNATAQRAKEIFVELIGAVPPAEWDDRLVQDCGDDADLRLRVQALLNAHRNSGDFLESPPTAVLESTEELHAQAPGHSLAFLGPTSRPESLGRLEHYEVLQVVGSGGMGIVLRAIDERLNRIVAIKVMAAQLATNATARKRFRREAQAAAAVNHDHVVTIHAVEDAGELPYLVMQFVAGISLQQRIDRDGPLQLYEILRIGMQTASGLAAAHAQGLVHRDITPANILLENGVERVKITDFGLARAATEANLTHSGVVAGTPQYMSPEQAEGRAIDQRTDLFSLGSVLYAMCTGRAPFRASGMIAVLKRVCEETPTPIGATNQEIPAWLVAIVDKLHAKDPAERFQSAAEVAELLGKCLAHVQHPSIARLPALPKFADSKSNPRPALRSGAGARAWRRRSLAIAAVVLVFLAVAVSLTEAAGVTDLRATVIRIMTPSGTLVVETDDPGIKVTVEGDGGLIITGAGPQEIRLKPGGYKLKAAKNGLPVRLDRDLVTIERGGKLVVKVSMGADDSSLENTSAPNQELWWRNALGSVMDIALSKDERQAVAVAGRRVFLFDPLNGKLLRTMEGHTDTIRSVVFSPDERSVVSGGFDATVRIWDLANGNEIRRFETERIADGGTGRPFSCLAFSPDGKRLLAGSRNDLLLWDWESGDLMQRFVGHVNAPRRVAFSPDGSLIASGSHDGTARIWRTETAETIHTLRDGSPWIVDVAFSPNGRFLATGGKYVTVWDVATGREEWRLRTGDKMAEALEFTPDGRFLLAGVAFSPPHEGNLIVLEAIEGREVARVGGLSSMLFEVKSIADSRDLLIGEADGMRRWRLSETLWNATKASSPEFKFVEPSAAFVLLASSGVNERKFDTLAQAVLGASSGDTIEICGNGPFVSDGVTVAQPLLIRAAEGYAPSIVLSRASADANAPLIDATATVALEGLELKRIGGAARETTGHFPDLITIRNGASLSVLNCRLFLQNLKKGRLIHIHPGAAPRFNLQNCEFYRGSSGQSVSWWMPLTGGHGKIENCVFAGGSIWGQQKADVADRVLSVTRSTMVEASIQWALWDSRPELPDYVDQESPIQLEFSENVAASSRFFKFRHYNLQPAMTVREAEALLPHLIALCERQNVYPSGIRMLQIVSNNEEVMGAHGQGIADWNRFWEQQETGSIEGIIRFEGGDLALRSREAPEQLTAEDFRLRPDSAGYRAGPDGKDLGADIDFVGPGAAYERWKETPGYQHWLEETAP